MGRIKGRGTKSPLDPHWETINKYTAIMGSTTLTQIGGLRG